jgi:plasmid maintenance system killer protein
MKIHFSTEKQSKLLNSSKELTKKFGAENAGKARRRMDDLKAAPRLEVMRTLPGRTHELHGDRAGTLAIDLHKGWRLIFEPAEDPPPVKADGGLDWTRVTEIRILEMEDYHE